MRTPFKDPLDADEIERECRDCGGDGVQQCNTCNGDGTHVCDCCHEHDCRDCDGNGEWPCERCFGAGCDIIGPRTALEMVLGAVPADVQRALIRLSPRLDAAGLPRWEPRLSWDRIESTCFVEILRTDEEAQRLLGSVGFVRVAATIERRDAYERWTRESDVVELSPHIAAAGGAA